MKLKVDACPHALNEIILAPHALNGVLHYVGILENMVYPKVFRKNDRMFRSHCSIERFLIGQDMS